MRKLPIYKFTHRPTEYASPHMCPLVALVYEFTRPVEERPHRDIMDTLCDLVTVDVQCNERTY